jgi:4-alpha-glucanotransferase
MQTERPALRRLADRMGIVPGYVDQSGSERRETSDETRVALLRAMGYDAATEERAEAALARLERDDAGRLLGPARVVRVSALPDERVRLRIPPGAHGRVAWLLTLEGEDGESSATEGEADAGAGTLELPLPHHPAPGYHRLGAALRWQGGDRSGEQALIVTPDTCWLPADEAEQPRFVGFTANLYTVRGARDWGIGNATTLCDLMTWGGEVGAAFVGVSPLHALWNRGTEVSPYSPVSRLYRNPLYIDVEAVPELRESDEARALLDDPRVRDEIRALRESPRVEYERIRALEAPILAALHRTFAERHRGSDSARGRAYAGYLAEQGQPLIDFATFLTLDEEMTREMGHPDWFRYWPSAYQAPRTSEVSLFREAHADRVDYHCWVQFELDRQLADVARSARDAGMRIGLYQDLAIGTSGGGSDAWAYPQLLLQGVSIGAPPDLLGPQGQDWGLPPIDPRRLAEDGYRYWIQLLQGAFQHAGALRIDHVLGLFRQFWIPWGMGAANGAYVRFPSEELLGILALESHRHQAIVVGEDLGTVPPEVPPTLERWKVLSSRVLYFETEPDGRFRPATSYPRHALATANTHDMAPLSGWWSGREIGARAAAGYMDDAERDRQLVARRDAAHRLRERLADSGIIPSADAELDDAALRGAVHEFLYSTPAMLVGISLDDLAGESEPVNMPGLQPDEFPSWTRKMGRTIDELRADPAVRTALGRAVAAGGRLHR